LAPPGLDRGVDRTLRGSVPEPCTLVVQMGAFLTREGARHLMVAVVAADYARRARLFRRCIAGEVGDVGGWTG
jgi:hypothetical protein